MSNLFSKDIKGLSFNFQPIEFGERMGYHVNVKDEEGVRWEFTMLNSTADDNTFVIEGESLPGWIGDLEKELYLAASEHE